jgi:hypothetical protein
MINNVLYCDIINNAIPGRRHSNVKKSESKNPISGSNLMTTLTPAVVKIFFIIGQARNSHRSTFFIPPKESFYCDVFFRKPSCANSSVRFLKFVCSKIQNASDFTNNMGVRNSLKSYP